MPETRNESKKLGGVVILLPPTFAHYMAENPTETLATQANWKSRSEKDENSQTFPSFKISIPTEMNRKSLYHLSKPCPPQGQRTSLTVLTALA